MHFNQVQPSGLKTHVDLAVYPLEATHKGCRPHGKFIIQELIVNFRDLYALIFTMYMYCDHKVRE